eukprot:842688_1
MSKAQQKFIVRRLEKSDYDKRHVELLGQLTDIGKVSRIAYYTAFDTMKLNTLQTTFAIEDESKNLIIGTITLIIEQKFVHSCSRVGHIEDVVADANNRGKGLGKLMIEYALNYAEQNG